MAYNSRRFFAAAIFLFSGISGMLFAPVSTFAGDKVEESFGPRPLDGVVVEALETYRNPKTNQIGLNLGVWPFNAYYTGFSLTGAYTYFFDKTYAWEVAQGSYLY